MLTWVWLARAKHELTKPKSTFRPQNFLSGLRAPHEQSFPFPTGAVVYAHFFWGGSGPSVNRCKIGEKRCQIGQEIFLPKGAKLGKIFVQSCTFFGERLDKIVTFQNIPKKVRKGAKKVQNWKPSLWAYTSQCYQGNCRHQGSRKIRITKVRRIITIRK